MAKWRLIGSAGTMEELLTHLEETYFFGPIEFKPVTTTEWAVSNRKGTLNGYRVIQKKNRWRFEIHAFN